jgi:hypothetical protein
MAKNIIHLIRPLLPVKEFKMEDFWSVCPFSKEDVLSKSRLKQIVVWRQVGMTWAVLEGNKCSHAAKMFGMYYHSAIVTYAQDRVYNALCGVHDPDIVDAVERILRVATDISLKKDDQGMRTVLSLVGLENHRQFQ